MRLFREDCTPPRPGELPLGKDEALRRAREVPGWVLKEGSMEREFKFGDFKGSMAFVNRVAELAESQGHHPDILILYSKVRLTLTTHKVGGLTRNDFILASKIDRLPGMV
ncbi:MAG: 4a-hydroxytetrahydrobiopterin dehydratase [Deltaproteobacteria bacterium]|nr:4a-hydroxytetrahydrobiopterin dehydratase [Deltaproteobacteria bacterium]